MESTLKSMKYMADMLPGYPNATEVQYNRCYRWSILSSLADFQQLMPLSPGTDNE